MVPFFSPTGLVTTFPTAHCGCERNLHEILSPAHPFSLLDVCMQLVHAPHQCKIGVGQINMRKVDGWRTLATNPIDQQIDLAAGRWIGIYRPPNEMKRL